jgi:archaellum component FlaC
MAFDQLTSNDKTKLNQFIEQGMKVLQDIADQKAGLKDVAKNLAEEFQVKPATLMKALSAAFKANIDEQRDEMTEIETILEATGRR